MGIMQKLYCQNETCGYRVRKSKQGKDRQLWMADAYLEGRSFVKIKCPNCRSLHEIKPKKENEGVLLALSVPEAVSALKSLEKYKFLEPEINSVIKAIRDNLEYWEPEKVNTFDKKAEDVIASIVGSRVTI